MWHLQYVHSFGSQGADRFYSLVKNDFYDGARFFVSAPYLRLDSFSDVTVSGPDQKNSYEKVMLMT
jgi:hypothetical protein